MDHISMDVFLVFEQYTMANLLAGSTVVRKPHEDMMVKMKLAHETDEERSSGYHELMQICDEQRRTLVPQPGADGFWKEYPEMGLEELYILRQITEAEHERMQEWASEQESHILEKHDYRMELGMVEGLIEKFNDHISTLEQYENDIQEISSPWM